MSLQPRAWQAEVNGGRRGGQSVRACSPPAMAACSVQRCVRGPGKGRDIFDLLPAMIIKCSARTRNKGSARPVPTSPNAQRRWGPLQYMHTPPSTEPHKCGQRAGHTPPHICTRGTAVCAAPSRPRSPPPARRGGTGPRSVTSLERCCMRLTPASWGGAPSGIAPGRPPCLSVGGARREARKPDEGGSYRWAQVAGWRVQENMRKY